VPNTYDKGIYLLYCCVSEGVSDDIKHMRVRTVVVVMKAFPLCFLDYFGFQIHTNSKHFVIIAPCLLNIT